PRRNPPRSRPTSVDRRRSILNETSDRLSGGPCLVAIDRQSRTRHWRCSAPPSSARRSLNLWMRGVLETKHEIDVRKADHIAAGDVEQRQVRRQLLAHESKAERVEHVVVRDWEQVILGYESDSLRESQLRPSHPHWLALD